MTQALAPTKPSPAARLAKPVTPTNPLWSQGWYRFAAHVPSPNCDERALGQDIPLLVIHSISLPPGHYAGDAVVQLFCNTLDTGAHPYYAQLQGLKVSAHFYIRRGGELIQFVSTHQRAWHAGVSSFQGVERCNDFSIGIELEGLEGETFEAAQYDTLVAITQALCEAHPLKAVASHQHIAPQRKADPGAGFEWQRLSLSAPALAIYV
jgi:N-acetyl-anhydromuramoyl-L-alanine amidase